MKKLSITLFMVLVCTLSLAVQKYHLVNEGPCEIYRLKSQVNYTEATEILMPSFSHKLKTKTEMRNVLGQKQGFSIISPVLNHEELSSYWTKYNKELDVYKDDIILIAFDFGVGPDHLWYYENGLRFSFLDYYEIDGEKKTVYLLEFKNISKMAKPLKVPFEVRSFSDRPRDEKEGYLRITPVNY
jgi:hypothetical protein